MNDDFDLPTRREMPNDLLDRLDVRLAGELDAIEAPRRVRWTPIVVAAGVVAVVGAGAVVLTNQGGTGVQPASTAVMPPPPPPPKPPAEAALDRCWAAVQAKGLTARYPDRATWQPVIADVKPLVTVVAARAAGKPLFCETTSMTVTVTDPDVTPAGHGVVLVSDRGTVAGVVDPNSPPVHVDVRTANVETNDDVQPKDGLFVFNSSVGRGTVTVDDAKVDHAPEPAVIHTVDLGPPGERTSDRGRALGTCLAGAGNVVQPDSWQPGAMVSTGTRRMVMAVNKIGVATCTNGGGASTFDTFTNDQYPGNPNRPVLLPVPPDLGDQPLIGGRLPAGVTRVRLVLPTGDTVDADVVASTFAVLLPASLKQEVLNEPVVRDFTKIVCRAYNAKGELVYDSPF